MVKDMKMSVFSPLFPFAIALYPIVPFDPISSGATQLLDE
jgi:hypothetical protein